MNHEGHVEDLLQGSASGRDAAATFKLLADETRLAILLALWEGYDPHGDGAGMSFSALRERVGSRDSGQFNYHLKKLEGRFVTRSEDGYRLHPVGLKIVQTIIADADGEAGLEPTEIEVDCPLCDAGTAITYADGWLYHVCTECDGGFDIGGDAPAGLLFAEPFPASALARRTPEELYAAGVFRLLQSMVLKIGGLCPDCSGVVDSSVVVCEDHDTADGERCDACDRTSSVRINWVCSVCKYRGSATPSGIAGLHPAVVAFYHDHGLALWKAGTDFESARQTMRLLQDNEQTVLSTDPLRVRVIVRYDGDQIALTMDESLDVVEVEE